MARIALEKYVAQYVSLLQNRFSEESVIRHIQSVYESKDYNVLSVRISYDVCRPLKAWTILSEEDWQNVNDVKIASLFKKSFRLAYPTAWKKIEELEK